MICTSQRNERRINEVMGRKSVARLARWGGDEWIKRPRISVSVSSQTGSESFIFIIWAASSPRCVWHEVTCAAAEWVRLRIWPTVTVSPAAGGSRPRPQTGTAAVDTDFYTPERISVGLSGWHNCHQTGSAAESIHKNVKRLFSPG